MDPKTNNGKPNTLSKLKKGFRLVVIILAVTLTLLILFLRKKPSDQSVVKEFQELKVISTIPNPPVYKSIWSTDPVVFTFDKVINNQTLIYSISPVVKTRASFAYDPDNKFSIIPLDGWKEDIEYTIVIDNGLTSLDNKYKLTDNIVFKFMRSIPEPGDVEYPKPDGEQ